MIAYGFSNFLDFKILKNAFDTLYNDQNVVEYPWEVYRNGVCPESLLFGLFGSNWYYSDLLSYLMWDIEFDYFKLPLLSSLIERDVPGRRTFWFEELIYFQFFETSWR